jgi:NADH/NAD ratio-sensing transcriptional regulator Rex
LSSKNERQRIVEWRRSKVLELSSQGNSQPEISRTLQISLGTVNKDLSYLRQLAQENLKTHIQQKLPEEYQRCLTGMNQVLKLSWQIANNNTRQRVKNIMTIAI